MIRGTLKSLRDKINARFEAKADEIIKEASKKSSEQKGRKPLKGKIKKRKK